VDRKEPMKRNSLSLLAAFCAAAFAMLPSADAGAQSQPPSPWILPSALPALPPLHLPGFTPTPKAAPKPPPQGLPATQRQCAPPVGLPPVRRAANLTVHSPPQGRKRASGTRLRTHIEGPLGNSKGRRDAQGRVWAGPEVPLFVPLAVGGKELTLLDPVDGGYLALYREPYGGNSCQLGDWDNCDYEVRLFDCAGAVRSRIDVNRHMSGRKHLEVADVRYADGLVYFNEACQTYSWQAGGRCSSLVAIDTRTGNRLWRSGFKVSNNVFLVKDRYLIAGFGFTGRPATLFLVRRDNGRVVRSAALKTKHAVGGSHDGLTILPGGLLRVGIYESDSDLMFRVAGLDGPRPTLSRLGVAPPLPRVTPKPRPRGHNRRSPRIDPFRGRR
jgi:hypothetical protein